MNDHGALNSPKHFSAMLVVLFFALSTILLINLNWGAKDIDADKASLIAKTSFYVDPTDHASINNIQSRSFKLFNSSIGLGFQQHPVWIKLEVMPQSKIKSLIIKISPPVLDEIMLFEPKDDGWDTRVVGDTYPKNLREVADSNFHFFISPSSTKTKIYFIKVTTSSLSNMNIVVQDAYNSIISTKKEDTINGMNLGMLIIFMLICMTATIINISGLSITLLFYAGLSISFILTFNGVLLSLLPNDLSPINDTIYKIMLVAKLFASHVLSYFLIKKIQGPKWYLKLFWINIPVFTFFFYSIATPFYLETMRYMIKYAVIMQVVHLIAVWKSQDRDIKSSVLLGYFTMFMVATIFQSNFMIQNNFITVMQLVSINTTITCLVFLSLYFKLSINERNKILMLSGKIKAHEQNVKSNGMLFDMLSHEVKNAVSTINLGAESLKESIDDDDDDDDDAKLRRKAALKKRALNIKLSALNITSILQRCLRLNEIEDGRVKLQPISFNLHDMLSEICKELAERASTNKILIQSGQNIGEAIKVYKDYFLFKLMLSNLIENACKYAVKDSVIMVNVASVQEWISIQVTNETSIGFPDENRLFERYYRSENAHRITGSGLGLVLIKKLANIFEGDVVYSHDDRHVTFTVKVKR